MQVDIFSTEDKKAVVPDIYECDDCGEIFTPEQVAARGVKDCPDCIDGELQPKYLPEL
jgi:formylmethanofuran dehydrogenase subunit E